MVKDIPEHITANSREEYMEEKRKPLAEEFQRDKEIIPRSCISMKNIWIQKKRGIPRQKNTISQSPDPGLGDTDQQAGNKWVLEEY